MSETQRSSAFLDDADLADPRPPRRWLRAVALLLIFVSGGVVGATSAMYYLREEPKPEERRFRGPPAPEKMAEHLRERLTLTDEQTAKIEAIFRESGEKLRLLNEEHWPRVSKVFEETNQSIEAQLTPEQLPAWKEWKDRTSRRGEGRGSKGEGRGPRGEGRGPRGDGRGKGGDDRRQGREERAKSSDSQSSDGTSTETKASAPEPGSK